MYHKVISGFQSVTICLFLMASFNSCIWAQDKTYEPGSTTKKDTVQTAVGELLLAKPYATKSKVKLSDVKGWEDNRKPIAPKGFEVAKFAEDLDHPRWLYIAPNGYIFVAESNTRSSADRITLIRDGKKMPFIEDLNQPFGMLILGNYFYVANTDGVLRFPYLEGAVKIEGKGEKILDLPAGGYNNHWTRNLLANKEGTKIYVSVGSASNVGEHGMDEEIRRAAILEINPDGSGEKIYASGLRNPVGMDWNPVSGDLWTAVNERDKLGNNLVPDYATSVKRGGFYGWPYSYYGKFPDPRWEKEPHTDMVNKAIVPDVSLGSHTASLGLTFYTAEQFPAFYQDGAFIGQHGSWNREDFAGYKVVFIPFEKGKPQPPQDFLTGFIAEEEGNDVYGRPVGVHQASDGSLFVVDDDSGIIWKVSYIGK